MANLKEIKRKISSVKGTQKTTRAMKLVSSAKLKRAEEVAKRSKVYATKLTELLNEIAQKMNNSDGEIDNVFLKAPSESYLINRFNFCCFNKTSCLRSSSLTSTSGRFIAFKSICFPRQEKKINKPKKAIHASTTTTPYRLRRVFFKSFSEYSCKRLIAITRKV